jgi:predicted AAA+ superfamily ATPase
MIQRNAQKEVLSLAAQFKAVAIVGPRQSGKTTLSKMLFPDKPYVNLENPDTRLFATDDPRGFLSNFPEGAILDEAQRVPELFSYLQQILDESKTKGLFVITGSNNFSLQENISQSLAGRVGFINLLPLTISEIGKKFSSLKELLFKGGYPVLYQENIDPYKWYANYVRTYVERDVRLIKNITNYSNFERFLKLCAARVGQLLNMSNLAIEVGVDSKTIQSWIGVLETSFVAFRLMPFHKNFNKRIVKMPKLYFYDTGLAANLLGLENENQLDLSIYKGPLFENLIVLELLKNRFNQGKPNNLFFWRNNSGHEIDVIIERHNQIIPVEIKSGQTITKDYFKGIHYWQKLTQTEGGFVVYSGDEMQWRGQQVTVLPYHNLEAIF